MALNYNNSNSITVQFKNALSSPSLPFRIQQINATFCSCSLKELQVVYPLLVENIFGIAPECTGWNIKRINQQENPENYDAVLRFLYPQGPLLDVAYKLLVDVYTKYEYNVTALPSNFKHLLEQGNLPAFFMDKLHIDPVTRQPLKLLLNAYELYMFHFVYHLVSPWHQSMGKPTGSVSDTVYLKLSDLYLTHLLPVDTSTVLPLVQINHLSPRSPPPQTTPVRVSKLFKQSALKKLLAATPVVSQPRAEIWRSEMLLLIVIYFWLDTPEPNSSKPPQISPSSSLNSSGFSSSFPRPNMTPFAMDGRASGDLLRVVRTFIKHVHYFANNLRNDGTAMDEMRKSILFVLRGPTHAFLRHNIHQWPLDASFSLMLETYLSFIQPWRYLKYNALNRNGRSTHVGPEWSSFISDNLEIYTGIIKLLLSRFLRVDLSSPRHSFMLYRLWIALSEPDLPDLLYEADVNAQIRGDLDMHSTLYNERTQQQVMQLLHKISDTTALVKQEKAAVAVKPVSMLKSFCDKFFGNPPEDTSHELQTTLDYLDMSAKNLCRTFGVEPPDPITEPGPVNARQPNLLDPVLARKRAAFIKYGGNPDLKPIRSDEIAALVRVLHRISTCINQVHGPEIAELWYRQDLAGKVSRQLLAGPCQTHHFHKTGPGNPAPLVVSTLPPRLCLRALASTKFVIFMLLMMLLPHVLGWSPPLFYIGSAFIYASIVFLKAIVSPYFNKDPGQEKQEPFIPLDVSFNEE